MSRIIIPKHMRQPLVHNRLCLDPTLQPKFPLINQCLISQQVSPTDLEERGGQASMPSWPKERVPKWRSKVWLNGLVVNLCRLCSERHTILQLFSTVVERLILFSKGLWHQSRRNAMVKPSKWRRELFVPSLVSQGDAEMRTS